MRFLVYAAAALVFGGCSTYPPQRYSPWADTPAPVAAAAVMPATQPVALPAARVAERAPAIKAVTPIGYVQKFLYQAEHAPEVLACGPPQVTLTGASAGLEMYSAKCSNGDVLVLRCQWGNCRVLR